MKDKVFILMATYNGAEYIKAQINSLLIQSYQEFEIYIRDDGSTDETIDILKEFCTLDRRIHFEVGSHKGASQNFAELIRSHTNSSYIMLCDQDDVWMQDKIEKSLRMIKRFDDVPTLLYCDKLYVDETLKELVIPVRRYEDTFKALLCQNHIYGCTMVLNRKLLQILNIPSYASMHDYWISLVASCKGRIIHLEEPLMYYRQHSSNVSGGIKQFNLYSKIRNWNKINKIEEKSISMCILFCKMNLLNNNIAKDYISIFECSGWKRLIRLFQWGYRRSHLLATIRGAYCIMKYKCCSLVT